MRLTRLSLAIVALPIVAIGCRPELAAPKAKSPAAPIARSAADGIPTQADAAAISANIVNVHLPYGTMADPGFVTSDPTSPDYYTVSTYNRTGDGANWTGHWLGRADLSYFVRCAAGGRAESSRG